MPLPSLLESVHVTLPEAQSRAFHRRAFTTEYTRGEVTLDVAGRWTRGGIYVIEYLFTPHIAIPLYIYNPWSRAHGNLHWLGNRDLLNPEYLIPPPRRTPLLERADPVPTIISPDATVLNPQRFRRAIERRIRKAELASKSPLAQEVARRAALKRPPAVLPHLNSTTPKTSLTPLPAPIYGPAHWSMLMAFRPQSLRVRADAPATPTKARININYWKTTGGLLAILMTPKSQRNRDLREKPTGVKIPDRRFRKLISNKNP